MPKTDWTGNSEGGSLRDPDGKNKSSGVGGIEWTGMTDAPKIAPPGPPASNPRDSGRTQPGVGRY